MQKPEYTPLISERELTTEEKKDKIVNCLTQESPKESDLKDVLSYMREDTRIIYKAGKEINENKDLFEKHNQKLSGTLSSINTILRYRPEAIRDEMLTPLSRSLAMKEYDATLAGMDAGAAYSIKPDSMDAKRNDKGSGYGSLGR